MSMLPARTKEEVDAIVEHEYVPGTAHLVDLEGTLNVKKNGNKKNSDIVLIPQPSSNPRDPLNWSYRRKLLHYYLLLVWGFLVAMNIAFLGPAYDYIIADIPDATYSGLVDASAVTYICLGMGCVLLQPTAMKIGRRATYLFASILIIIALIVGGTAKNMAAIFIFSAFGGIGAAPVDSLVQVSTTDIFFQHERGDKLSAFIFVIYGGSYIGPIFSGYFAEMTDGVGWRWDFWLCLAAQGVFLFFQVLLMEDSTFRREESQMHVEETILRQITTEREVGSTEKDQGEVVVEEIDSERVIKPIPYRERLKLFNFEYNDPRSWFIIALRPLLCLSFPPVVFAGILYGVQIAFLSLTANTQTSIFTAEPYNFSAKAVGNTNVSSLVGSCIGMIWGGRIADWITIKLARRNKGVLEPEMRLYAMVFPALMTAAGLLMYGLGANNGVNWFVPAGLGRAFISIGICSSGPIVITYAIDCYPALASESVVLILFMRNAVGCVFTFVVTIWLDNVGLVSFTWTVFAIALAVIGGFSFLMILFGKNLRRKTKHLYARFQDRSRLF